MSIGDQESDCVIRFKIGTSHSEVLRVLEHLSGNVPEENKDEQP